MWHSLSTREVVKKLKTNIKTGLSEKEVIFLRKKFGENKLSKEESVSFGEIFLDQFKSPLVYVLLIAGVLLLFFKETRNDSFIIFFAVFLSVLFGFWEENKASQIILKLKKILKTKTVVLRDGKKKEVFQEELVPGDIIFIKEGDKIPADARLIEAEDLKVSEAVLTGEWVSAEKKVGTLPKETPLAERDNMVYTGCIVEKGRGVGVVVATGDNTEVGKIAGMLSKTKEEETPLQQRLKDFSKKITLVVIFLCILIFVTGVLREKDILRMFETSVAISVGAIPEALPITLTVILAIGAEKILKKKGLVRSLKSVETLGSTSIICTDKTKTITEGKMIPEKIIVFEEEIFPHKIENIKNKGLYKDLFISATLCNEAFIEKKKKSSGYLIRGEETDKGLLRTGILYGLDKDKLEEKFKLLKRIPFRFEEKYQAVFYKKNGNNVFFVSGAPEKIIALSNKVLKKDKEDSFSQKEKEDFLKKIEIETEKGFRVIALAQKQIGKKEKDISDKLIFDLTFLGAVVLKDPLRKDVKKVILACKRAGLFPIIITGDYKKTAKSIANEIGLEVSDDEILEGTDLDKLSDKEFKKIAPKIKIYARAEPRHKMRIIDAWQEKGKVVAMTGDGVNDAPALKSADVGVALGSGTDVAKEASDIILLEDSFSVILHAIEQGRVILDNIRKAIAYTIADCFSCAIIIGVSTIIFGWPIPLLPVHILWNDILEDTFPNVSFAFEPGEKNVMRRKPTAKKTSLFGKEGLFLTLGNIVFNFLAVFYFWFFWRHLNMGIDFARTIVFGVICVDTAFVIFSYKNLKENIWKINPFSNKFLNISAIFSLLGFALVIYIPFLRQLFHTVPLGVKSWLFLIADGVFTMLFMELIKFLYNKYNKDKEKEKI